MVAREAAENAKGEEAERASAVVVDAAYRIHVELGPGLLESVYEAVLARALERRDLRVLRQVGIPFEYDGMRFDEGLRADLLVNDALIVELKSVEKVAPVHSKQLLTYLRLSGLSLGLLINFGAATFKEGCHRVVNNHPDFAASRLRVSQECRTRGREEESKNSNSGLE